MRVFIMWSGEETKPLAEALLEFLRHVVRGPRYFISTQKIDTGEVWQDTLAKELSATNFGIACMTPLNATSQWIHFEAGAISKVAQDACIVPYLIGMRGADLTGPLTKYQTAEATESGTYKLVQKLAKAFAAGEIADEDALKGAFDWKWAKLNDAIKLLEAEVDACRQAADPTEESPVQPRAAYDMLAELLESVRELRNSGAAKKPDASIQGRNRWDRLAADFQYEWVDALRAANKLQDETALKRLSELRHNFQLQLNHRDTDNDRAFALCEACYRELDKLGYELATKEPATPTDSDHEPAVSSS